MEANAGKAFQMQVIFNILPHISLYCKLVPVQYWEYEYGTFEVELKLVNTLRTVAEAYNFTIPTRFGL